MALVAPAAAFSIGADFYFCSGDEENIFFVRQCSASGMDELDSFAITVAITRFDFFMTGGQMLCCQFHLQILCT